MYMAYITGSVTDGLGTLPFSLSAGTQLTMSIQNTLVGASYYGLETFLNQDGFYTSATPKNLSGSFILGSGITDIVYDNYKMVAVVQPGGGSLVYTPAIDIDANTLATKGTGANLGSGDFATLLANGFSTRVTGDGGIIEDPGAITNTIVSQSLFQYASYLMVPSGYKEDTLYSELSTNNYSDLAWTRASDAWRTNSSGLVQRVPWNLLKSSETFDVSPWAKTRTTINANVVNAPNGTLTADELKLTNVGSNSYSIQQSVTSSLTTNTFSLYVKYKDRQFIQLVWGSGYSSNEYANFDLINGIVTAGIYSSATIVASDNEFYRISITTTGTSTTPFCYIWPVDSGVDARAAACNGVGSYYLWGAQLVEGSSAQTYFPTTDRLNVPRLDYTYGTDPAALLEPQRTNLVLYSEQFDTGSWTAIGSTITANSQISPDGTQNADTMTIADSNSRVSQNVVLGAGTYRVTVYVKLVSQTSPGTMRIVGVVDGANTNISFTPTSQWQRIDGTYTATVGITNLAIRGVASSFIGTVAIWGFQAEAGAYATTYIPTTSATVTRLVDTFSRSNVYTNGMITSAGGTWYTELRNNIAYAGNTQAQQLGLGNDAVGATADNFWIGISSSTTRMILWKQIAGSLTSLYTTLTDTAKIAIKWNGSTADIFVNGVKVVTATSFTPTALESLRMFTAQSPYYIQQMALYSQPIAGVDMGVLTGASYYPSFLNMAQALNYTIA